MRKNYILVEDVIREELMYEQYVNTQIRRALVEGPDRLDEGLKDIYNAVKNWPKIKKAINGVISICKNIGKYKKLISTIKTITGGNPGKILAWFFNSKLGSKIETIRKMDANGRAVTVQVCKIAGYQFDAAFKPQFDFIKESVSTVCDTFETILGLFGPVGNLIKCAIAAAKSVVTDILSGLKNWFKIICNAVDKIIESILGFSISDVINLFSQQNPQQQQMEMNPNVMSYA